MTAKEFKIPGMECAEEVTAFKATCHGPLSLQESAASIIPCITSAPDADRSLRVRFQFVLGLFVVVALAHFGLTLERTLNIHARSELLDKRRAEVHSRIAVVKLVQSEVVEMQERARKLMNQAAKIAAEANHPKTAGDVAPSESSPRPPVAPQGGPRGHGE